MTSSPIVDQCRAAAVAIAPCRKPCFPHLGKRIGPRAAEHSENLDIIEAWHGGAADRAASLHRSPRSLWSWQTRKFPPRPSIAPPAHTWRWTSSLCAAGPASLPRRAYAPLGPLASRHAPRPVPLKAGRALDVPPAMGFDYALVCVTPLQPLHLLERD